jgi:hypothetical protein
MAHTNAQIRHLFAQQGPDSTAEGSNGAHTFFFTGNRLYSYQTPIAKWHHISRGRTAVLITSDGYSPITKTKQLSGLASALHGLYMHVPYVGENGGRAPTAFTPEQMHAWNLEYLLGRYAEAKVRQMKSRSEPSITEMADRANWVHTYCDWFDLKGPRLPVDLDFIEIRQAWEKRDTPEAKARRKADKEKRDAKRKEAQRVQDERSALQREEWRRGERRTMAGVPNDLVMFRLKDIETVQTSLGAEVPLRHAVRVFQFVKWVRMSGQRWQKNGHRIPVGRFEIDSIEPNGDFRAGCHSITWAEVERFAVEINVFEEAASIAAEIQTAE